VLAEPSSALGRSLASFEVVLSDVLAQFAKNFLLNDLSEEVSDDFFDRDQPAFAFPLPRREPRRRPSGIEQVHQARVSIRRLRSTLRTFEELFESEWLSPMASELSWYAATLGEVRDFDVLGSSLSETVSLIDDDRVRTIVTSHLGHQRDIAQDQLTKERSTKRYARLVNDVATIGSTVRFREDLPGSALENLRHEVRRTWKRVKIRGREAKNSPTNEHLHRLRIELKRLQCACEVVALVDTADATKVARAAEISQTHLGVVHDQAVASTWLRTLVVDEPRLRKPLRAILRMHDEQRKVAKSGWLDELAKVERRWRRWDI
jgi:CHAD domain-containing protein